MTRRRTVLAAIAGALAAGAAAALAAGTPAAAAPDTKPPSLKLPAYAGFVAGSQVSDTALGEDRFDAYYPGSTLAQKFRWVVADAASGVCDVDVYAVPAGDDPGLVLEDTGLDRLTVTSTDYDDQVGGGIFKILGYEVVATDCAGNSRTKFVTARPTVTQEDGWTYGYRGVTLAYEGAWATSRCACWSADRTAKTSEAGAAVTITQTWRKGETVALVMATGPNRGEAEISVDGVVVDTIDTYAEVPTHRVVTWTARLTEGPHEIRVVNLATDGRPRIDLDAVLNGSAL